MAEEAAALAGGICGEGDAAEVGAEDVGDFVVLGEALVEEGVVGAEEFGDGAVFAEDVCEEEFSLAAHGLAEVVVEIDEAAGVGGDGVEAAEVEPLGGEVGDEVFGAGVGEHAPDVRGEDGGLRESAALGGGEEGFVGETAPEEEGEARGKFEVADAVGCAGRERLASGGGGRRFEAEEELGGNEDGAEGGLDAGFEAGALGATFVKELERAAEVVFGDGAAVGAAEEGSEDGAGSGIVGGGGGGGWRGGRGGEGAKDGAAAGGVAGGAGGEGAGDGDLKDRGGGARVAVHVEARGKGGALVFEDGRGVFRERHPEVVRASGDGEAELEVLVDGLGVFIGAGGLHGGDGEAGAVEENFDVVGAAEAFDLFVAVALEADLDIVVAFLGEGVGDQDTAAGAEWQALDVVLLRDIGADAEGVAARGFAGRADGETGDFLRGGDVAVEEGGRKVTDGDVVETVAGLVVREQGGGVDIDGEEIADGVAILGAV